MNRSAELQFGTLFCIRRVAIVPNRSSALPIHTVHGPNAREKTNGDFP